MIILPWHDTLSWCLKGNCSCGPVAVFSGNLWFQVLFQIIDNIPVSVSHFIWHVHQLIRMIGQNNKIIEKKIIKIENKINSIKCHTPHKKKPIEILSKMSKWERKCPDNSYRTSPPFPRCVLMTVERIQEVPCSLCFIPLCWTAVKSCRQVVIQQSKELQWMGL